MIRSSIDSWVSTKFLFIINRQLRKYIMEGTCIHTMFQPGLNSYPPFSFVFCFLLSLENVYTISPNLNKSFYFEYSFFLIIIWGGFLFTYFVWISWNQITCNEICIKLCFMKWSERNISECIPALRLTKLSLLNS